MELKNIKTDLAQSADILHEYSDNTDWIVVTWIKLATKTLTNATFILFPKAD